MRAGDAIRDGRNVLVAAPTGSGKTVVGEMAVDAALEAGGRAFYTAPIKALSNQKFHDLRAVLGSTRVGLLTGDHSINAGAEVVVMTTEVLRNMVYARSEALEDLMWVVLDEVHFLQDTYRGPVWEEVLIHTPAPTRFACLSATVSNAVELGEWIGSLRGPTATVVEHDRPVELEPLLMVGDRQAERDHLVSLLVDGRPNEEGNRFDSDDVRGTTRRGAQGRGPRRRFRTPRQVDVVERLADEALLPAIHFIFSRKGCEEAAARCVDAGVRLSTVEDSERIRAIVEDHAMALDDSDLDVLGYDRFADTLSRGIASHHAGMVPAFREAVEECFVKGLIKVVFATETLALGINMPARTVVIERLTKFTGDGHEMLTPAQFTQLTGRAGRRGIDEYGSAVVLWSPFIGFARVAELAASRDFPLQSVFRPTYNMAANLVERYDREEAHRVLARSFAQFQADRSMGTLRTRLERTQSRQRALHEEFRNLDGVDPGSAAAYLELVTAQRRLSSGGSAAGGVAQVERSLAALNPGDVIERPTSSGSPGLLVVVATSQRRGSTRIQAVTPRARLVRLDASRLSEPIRHIGDMQLPVPSAAGEQSFRKAAAARLRRVNTKGLRRSTDPSESADPRIADADEAVQEHPLNGHGQHTRILELARDDRRAEREIRDLQRRIADRGTDLVARFDKVLGVLDDLDHLRDWELTPSGRRLRRIYHESDLLVSLTLSEGLLDDLDAPAIAALVSCLTHEHRSAETPPAPRLPSSELHRRFGQITELASGLRRREVAAGIAPGREPSAGFAMAAYGWTSGRSLEEVLAEDMSGGDFVRNTRQLIDLLRQLGDIAPAGVARAARSAASLMRRDVVEAGGQQ